MAAYNGVNGQPMTENPLLRDILHGEWGFDGRRHVGLVRHARTTVPSADAALDLVMPGPAGPWGDALVAAVRAGEVDEAAIDDKVLRILRLAARVGALEGSPRPSPPGVRRRRGRRRRCAARRRPGFVLARNEGAVLPLDGSALRGSPSLGPNAAVGADAGRRQRDRVPALHGLAARRPARRAVRRRGRRTPSACAPSDRVPVAGPPWIPRRAPGRGALPRPPTARVLADRAAPRLRASPGWARSARGSAIGDVARVEVARRRCAPTEAGTYVVAGSGVGRYELSVGGEKVFDGELELPPGADIVEGIMIPPQAIHSVDARTRARASTSCSRHEVGSMATDVGDLGGCSSSTSCRRTAATTRRSSGRSRSRRDADVAVVVVGTTEEVESEGFDRTVARAARAARTSSCAASRTRTRGPSSSSTPARRCCCRGPTRWPRSCSRGSPARSSATRWPTSCSGVAEPGGRLPMTLAEHRGRPALDAAGRRRADLRRGALDRLPRRPAARRCIRSATGSATRLGATSSIERRRGRARPDVPVACACATPARAAARRSCSSTRAAPRAAIERPARWLAGFATRRGRRRRRGRGHRDRAAPGLRALGRSGRGLGVEPGASGWPPGFPRRRSPSRPRSRSSRTTGTASRRGRAGPRD